MKATRFMRLPFFVLGHEVHEDNMVEIAKWCEGHVTRTDDRSFIRVPVDRPLNKRQTEAELGSWVLLSRQRGFNSFKVYEREWLDRQFVTVPEEVFDVFGTKSDIEIRSTIPSPNNMPMTRFSH